MKRNRIVWTIVLALAVTGAATATLRYAPRFLPAQADSLPSLLQMVPPDSTFVAYVDVAALRDSPLVQHFLAMAPAATTERDYADFVQATGFDYQRDLDHVVLASRGAFATQGATQTLNQTLTLAEGRFDREKIERYALSKGKVQQVAGKNVYVLPSSTANQNISLTFLTNDRIALANGGDLTPILAALSTGTPLDAALRDRLSRVAGSPVFVVVKAPAAGLVPAGADSSTSPFAAVRWATIAARPNGDDVILSAEGECDSPKDATKMAGMLDIGRTLLRAGLANPNARGQMSAEAAVAAGHVLDAATITTDAGRVRVVATVTAEMLGVSASTTHTSH